MERVIEQQLARVVGQQPRLLHRLLGEQLEVGRRDAHLAQPRRQLALTLTLTLNLTLTVTVTVTLTLTLNPNQL